jgi:hypothetical protein
LLQSNYGERVAGAGLMVAGARFGVVAGVFMVGMFELAGDVAA